MNTATRPALCPSCGYMLDRVSSLYDPRATPKPGDITVCINCKKPLIFGEALRLRRKASRRIASLLQCRYGFAGRLVRRPCRARGSGENQISYPSRSQIGRKTSSTGSSCARNGL